MTIVDIGLHGECPLRYVSHIRSQSLTLTSFG